MNLGENAIDKFQLLKLRLILGLNVKSFNWV